MATAAVLEDAITCCICFNVYRDPHALPCLHTLCKPCIDQLAVSGKVECPECRETTEVNKIRKDFKTQTLIDDHQRKVGVGVPKQTIDQRCGMCNELNKGMVSHCKECENFMCFNCDKLHQGMKVCKGHTVSSVKDIIENTKSKLEIAVHQWKTEKALFAKKSDESDDIIKCVQTQRDDQIMKTNIHFDRLISDLEKDRATLLKGIRELNGEQIKDLRKNKQVYNQIGVEIQTQIDMLEEIIDNAHITTMTELVEDMNKSLQGQIDNIRQRVVNFTAENVSPVQVVTDEKSYSSGIYLKKQCQGPLVSAADYSKLKTNKYQLQKKHITKVAYIFRICSITNNLWCAAYEDGILIYNSDLELVREIKSDKYTYVVEIAEWNEDVIVACSNNNGLHQIKQSGEYVQQIAEGSFADVAIYDGKVYVLHITISHIRITIYACTNNVLVEVHNFMVENGGHFWDKLCIQGGLITVSLNSKNCLQQYNLEGKLIRKYPKTGRPIICGMDKNSNFLVAENDGNQLQVFDSQQQSWNTIALPWPTARSTLFDAVVDNCGENIWVVTRSSTPYILKFTLKP